MQEGSIAGKPECSPESCLTTASRPTAERFAAELAMVVRTLDLTAFHVWGHSWGTALAVLYALTQATGLTQHDAGEPDPRSPHLHKQDVTALLARQPPAIQEAIRTQPLDSSAYLAALAHVYHGQVYTADPWDACARKAFSPEEFGLESDVTTVGANELSYTGNFANRDDSARLGEIVVPTLLTCGRADLATPATSALYQRNLPGSRFVVFEHSAHWAFEEARALSLMTLRNFVREHD